MVCVCLLVSSFMTFENLGLRAYQTKLNWWFWAMNQSRYCCGQTQVGRSIKWYQNDKLIILDFNEARDNGEAVASAALYADRWYFPQGRLLCLHLITQFFTGWMLFLMHNQQCQSIDGKSTEGYGRNWGLNPFVAEFFCAGSSWLGEVQGSRPPSHDQSNLWNFYKSNEKVLKYWVTPSLHTVAVVYCLYCDEKYVMSFGPLLDDLKTVLNWRSRSDWPVTMLTLDFDLDLWLQFNQSGQLSNSQDGCQTNFRRYDP